MVDATPLPSRNHSSEATTNPLTVEMLREAWEAMKAEPLRPDTYDAWNMEQYAAWVRLLEAD